MLWSAGALQHAIVVANACCWRQLVPSIQTKRRSLDLQRSVVRGVLIIRPHWHVKIVPERVQALHVVAQRLSSGTNMQFMPTTVDVKHLLSWKVELTVVPVCVLQVAESVPSTGELRRMLVHVCWKLDGESGITVAEGFDWRLR